MSEPILCDTCGQPCAGGAQRYVDGMKRNRIGCTDEIACQAAFAELNREQRRIIERRRREGAFLEQLEGREV